MKNIISFSGGKDSTAMLFMMIEKGIRVDEIVYCHIEKAEFKEMLEHIELVKERLTNDIIFTELKLEISFEEGVKKYSWPDFQARWCTTLFKVQRMKKYLNDKYGRGKYKEYVGIAFDEPKRIKEKNYPLFDWKITEKEALQYCYDIGFYWSGLYENFDRLSCFLCPLQRIGELRHIFNLFPEHWKEMERLDKFSKRRFRNDYSVEELRRRFEAENRKLRLPGM